MGSASFRPAADGGTELVVDYGVERDRSSWLEELGEPVMLVTGAAGFIGRYVVDLLVTLGHRVAATDVGPRPAYLSQPKFAGVTYEQADLREEGEVAAVAARARPAVVFHVGALFDFSAPATLLSEVNVAGTARVCEAARESGAGRVVYWSSGSIYAASEEPAREGSPKAPADPYAESKYEGELAAFEYHDPGRFEVYSVRPAMVSGILSRYGSGTVARLIREGYFIGPPQRRGMLTAVVNARDVATCAYLVAAGRPGGAAASSDDTAFNAAADPVDVDSMMRALAAGVPRECILGVRTRLAEVTGFGYQETVRLPDFVLELAGRASVVATRALNAVRPSRLQPKIPPETIPYLTRPHPMSNAKAREVLGWRPDPVEADLAETLRWYTETGWTGFDRTLSVKEDREAALLDEAEALIEAAKARTEAEPAPVAKIASLGLEVDRWSLRILLQAAKSYVLNRAYGGGLAELLVGVLPRAASRAAEDVALYMRHAYAARFGRGGLPEEEAPGLLLASLRLDRNDLSSWILAANVARFLGAVADAGEVLGRGAYILPEGAYGLLIETEFGDVAVEFDKRGPDETVFFPRAAADSIPSHVSLQEKADRLRKARRMGLAFAARFEDLARLLAAELSLDELTRVVTASPHVTLMRLVKRVSRAGWDAIVFEDEDGVPILGVRLRGRAGLFSRERLMAFAALRKDLPGEELAGAFQEAAGGRLKLYPAAEFRRLLADATRDGVVSRLLGR